jgi:repressor LexA
LKTLLSKERLAFLRKWWRENGRLPSARELIALIGLASPRSATLLYRAAQQAGYVQRSGRAFTPTPLLAGLPCYGSISAGFPSPAEEELCDVLSIEEYLVGRREAIFLVRVSGDSMTGAGIMPGDVIVVERGAEARHGEIVVAEVDGEWTLKRYQRDRSGVKLVAENPKYPEIRPGQNLTIGGVIRGAFRRYGR